MTGTAKVDRRTKKQARKLSISSPDLSKGINLSLKKHFVRQQVTSVLCQENVSKAVRERIMWQIYELISRINQLKWADRERLDRRQSTKRTKSINGILKTIERLEKKLLSSDFDKFPEDYFAREVGRDLKRERIQALYSLRDNLKSIKGKVGQRNELKRHVAIRIKSIFDEHGIPCKKSKSYSAFESTFQIVCKHLHMSFTDNVWHYLRKNKNSQKR